MKKVIVAATAGVFCVVASASEATTSVGELEAIDAAAAARARPGQLLFQAASGKAQLTLTRAYEQCVASLPEFSPLQRQVVHEQSGTARGPTPAGRAAKPSVAGDGRTMTPEDFARISD